MTDLVGKAVLVTGAGRGLGRSYARAAARAGAKVMVNDVDADAADGVTGEIVAAGGVAAASHHSVSDPEAVEAMMASCVDMFGTLDALVNNAGLFMTGPAEAVDLTRARQLIDVNFYGVLHCGLAAYRRMADRGGVIVNVTSGASLGIAGMSIYGASKAAVSALTTHWAMEWAGKITVIGLSPIGFTRMTRAIGLESGPDPDDTGALVSYLLSAGARHLHGRTIRYARGDLHMLEGASFRPLGAVSAGSGVAAFAAILDAIEPGGATARGPMKA